MYLATHTELRIDDAGEVESKTQTLDVLTVSKYSVNPQQVLNKILLYANKAMLPLEVDEQVLDKTDLNFMMQHGVSADEVKKMKALALFLKKNQITF